MTYDWTGNQQTKQKWHEWRGKGLGSSDAPVLMGTSPWKTVFKLWLEKTGQEDSPFTGNYATERGNRLEPMVRDWYNREHGTEMVVDQAESDENPTWRASFDGIDRTVKRLIEIKCPGLEDHTAALNGNIPEKYIPQVQWLLMVSGFDYLDYVSYNDKVSEDLQYVVVFAKRDEELISEMKKRAVEFWHFVQTRTRPPEVGMTLIEDPECERLIEEYQTIVRVIREAEKEQGVILDKIKSYVKEGRAMCANYSLSWVERKGNVDYAKIPELSGVDVEKYRRPSTTYFTMKEGKK